jgi:DNA mismatch repair ATPase MutS
VNYLHFDGAAELQGEEHEYAEDIDLFGDESVFQLLNRTSTVGGREQLSEWCLKPEINVGNLRLRQGAVAELKEMPEFRVLLETYGSMAAMKKNDLKKLTGWIQLPPLFEKSFFKFLPVLISALSLAGIALIISGVISFTWFLLYLALGPWMITGFYLRKINHRHNYLSRSADLFSRYSKLFELLATTDVKNEYLRKLKKRAGENNRATEAVRKLGRITASLDTRLNMLMGFILNGLFLWDIIQLVRLEKWQEMYGQEISEWFDTVAVFDALCSLSGFAYNFNGFVFPQLSDDTEDGLKIVDAGHPLIPAKERVGNNFSLNGNGQFVIITGANMAGKSTFLRTVAVNMMLAMAGTVVCAEKMVFKPVQLITSLRTTDNLVRNESYFFAELKRLKWIIDRLNSGERLFIILDEILKGTNSKDKQQGSKALIEQFVRLNATGIIATHDIILGTLAESYPDKVMNRCFEVSLKKDTLVFDYKLREGISQNMNATFLMKQMGITL